VTGEALTCETLIYSFSGTGSSLLVAGKIAQRLEDAAPRPLMELLRGPKTAGPESAPAVGLVFPIYFDRMPEIVRSALETRALPAAPYVFAVGRIDPAVKGQYRCPGMAAGDIRQARG
jgi:hypothetical protein